MNKYPYLDGQMSVHIRLDTLIQFYFNKAKNKVLEMYIKKSFDLKFAKVYIRKNN